VGRITWGGSEVGWVKHSEDPPITVFRNSCGGSART
jgi:hypothetical protein